MLEGTPVIEPQGAWRRHDDPPPPTTTTNIGKGYLDLAQLSGVIGE